MTSKKPMTPLRPFSAIGFVKGRQKRITVVAPTKKAALALLHERGILVTPSDLTITGNLEGLGDLTEVGIWIRGVNDFSGVPTRLNEEL